MPIARIIDSSCHQLVFINRFCPIEFRMPFQRKLVVPTCLVEQLPEEITITEGFATQIRVVVNLSWQLTVIIIVIQFTGKTMDEVKTLLKSVLDEMIVEGEIE